MLNQAFPKCMKSISNDNYILDINYRDEIISQNTSTNCGIETRIEEVFTYEIRKKLENLDIRENDFDNKIVMDICGGAGFLSYHLLQKKINPKKIVICDISSHELSQAKKCLDSIKGNIIIEYLCENIGENHIASDSFDIIIGNSFLHHFYNIPEFLSSIIKILKPGGYFIGTHEPTINAVAIESGCFPLYIYALIRGKKYIDDIRYKGNSIKPNNLGDVRVFEERNIRKVFDSVGFQTTIFQYSNITKSFLTTNFGLSPLRIPLSNKIKHKLLKIGIRFDTLLQQLLPDKYFGELFFKTQK